MTVTGSVQDLVNELTGKGLAQAPAVQYRRAVVQGVGTTLTIRFAGSTVDVSGVQFMRPYRPTPGDVVFVLMVGQVPVVIGSDGGSYTGYTHDLSVISHGHSRSALTGFNKIYLQGGTHVVSSNSNGFAWIPFPTAFPNGIIITVSMNGDWGSGSIIHASALSDRTGYEVRTQDVGGGVVINTLQRFDYIALGW